MNEATDYVHTHVINYEPTYIALGEAVTMVWDDEDIHEARDYLADVVDQHWQAMGLDASDLADVDYAEMIDWEMSN